MNKRGTHVEMIISSIIFITFVIFLLVASKPSITKQEDKKNLFDSIEFQIMENVSEDVKIITLSMPAASGGCVTLDNSLTDLGIENNIIVKDSSGEIVADVGTNGDSITIDVSPTDTFFKIYYSEEFDSVLPDAPCASANENIGLTKTNKYVFQKKVSELISESYSTVRQRYGVAENMEFTYGIVLFNGTVIEKTHQELSTNISTNVYVKDTPIEYIDLEGNILAGYLRTKIW